MARQVKKTGKASWKPGAKLDILDRDKDFRYRWVNASDAQNIVKKQSEGWVMVNQLTGVKGSHDRQGTVEDGQPLTSATEFRELVAMALPEETAQARDEYFEEQTRLQTVGAKNLAKAKLNEAGLTGAPVHGSVTVGGETID